MRPEEDPTTEELSEYGTHYTFAYWAVKDEKKYAEKIEKHHRDTGIRESGNATVTIGEMIAEECGAAEA